MSEKEPVKRPNCVSCNKWFSDSDVETENFFIVGMSMENGPSFCHKKCPGMGRSIYE